MTLRYFSASVIAVFLAFAAMFPLMAGAAEVQSATTTIEENLKNIVSITCGNYDAEGNAEVIAGGSGVILDDGVVITNAHVISEDGGDVWLIYDWCVGGVSEFSYLAPEPSFFLTWDEEMFRLDDYFDYALMRATDIDGNEIIFDSTSLYGNADSLVHGDAITLIGYPGLGGETITSTQGTVSGFQDSDWIKTDAFAEFGNSGGGAFDANGNFIGIPTIVLSGELNSLTLIQNLNAILEDIFGTDAVQRDYLSLYTSGNITCLWDECYNFGVDAEEGDIGLDEQLDEPLPPESGNDSNELIDETASTVSVEPASSKYDASKHDQGLIDRMVGRILLQVEQHGEAWYVHPVNKLRYYMKDGPTAYQMMREFGLGITDVDLSLIPEVATADEMLASTSYCGTSSLARSVKGRILLQVEQHGEAWYVHPEKCRRIYMKDGEAAYDIMRFLSTGIADANLKSIPSDSL